MFSKVLIRQHERGLRFRQGDFIAPLGPGRHTLFNPPWDSAQETVEVVDTLKCRFDHPLLATLVRDTELREQLTVAELTDTQRGIVFRDGQAFELIGPGRHAYWNTPAKIEIELFDITHKRLRHPKLAQVLALPVAGLFLERVTVAEGERSQVLIDGVPHEEVGPGVHAYWRGGGRVVSIKAGPVDHGVIGQVSRKGLESLPCKRDHPARRRELIASS